MRILFLTFYFKPDLCAGSFRNSALLDQLLKVLPENSHIDIVATLPNRYAGYAVEAPSEEQGERYTIHRVELPNHNSGMFDQSISFAHFAAGAIKITRGRKYDLVYASSSRLMTASLGALLSKRAKAPLYLDIRDIFVDTIKDILPGKAAPLIGSFFSLVEKWSFSSAVKVNLVSEGFRQYFEERYPKQCLSYFTNGIDEEFSSLTVKENNVDAEKIPLVVYAGNMGEGQGLHNVVPELAKRLEGKVKFKLVGGGGRLDQLKRILIDKCVTNVQLIDPVSRTELMDIYEEADVLFLHLNDHEAFRKVLPSKLFEYAALGKPIWAGLGGYAAEFVNVHIDNAAVFRPCNVFEAEESLKSLEMKTMPRARFVRQFARERIMTEMSSDIINTVELYSGPGS